jgi:hypothetical protein
MQSSSSPSRNTIIIIVIVLIVLCCCCVALVGAAGIGFSTFRSQVPNGIKEILPENIIPTEEPFLTTSTPENPEPPQEVVPAENTPEGPTDQTLEPTEVPTNSDSSSGDSSSGLGVTRQEMIDYFNVGSAFKFGEPFTAQGMEAVMGQHATLCIKTNCASVTLLGPADNITVVSVAVPTDPKDITQTATAITLLMNAVVRFSPNDSALFTQMMTDITSAQAAGTNLAKNAESGGFKIFYNYVAQTHNAGVAITK